MTGTRKKASKNTTDRKPEDLPQPKQRRKSPRVKDKATSSNSGDNNAVENTKAATVPVSPPNAGSQTNSLQLTPTRVLNNNSPISFSPLSLNNGTLTPPAYRWPNNDHLPFFPLDDADGTYIRIPARKNGFTSDTWWMVDLTHQPPIQQGATILVARCLLEYQNWDEAWARRVKLAYQQYLALATEVEDRTCSRLIAPPLVDQMWSQHCLDLASYCHDCMLLCGQVLCRNPFDVSNIAQRRTFTLQQLKLKFGEDYDPEIWSYGEEQEEGEPIISSLSEAANAVSDSRSERPSRKEQSAQDVGLGGGGQIDLVVLPSTASARAAAAGATKNNPEDKKPLSKRKAKQSRNASKEIKRPRTKEVEKLKLSIPMLSYADPNHSKTSPPQIFSGTIPFGKRRRRDAKSNFRYKP